MPDFRQLGISGATSQPFMNLRPVGRIASRYGRAYSGAYDRAAAQYAQPIISRLKILGGQRRMASQYQDWMRGEQRRRMLQQRQMMGLKLAGGVAGDVAEWWKSKQMEPGQVRPEIQALTGPRLEVLNRYLRGQPVTEYAQRHGMTLEDIQSIVNFSRTGGPGSTAMPFSLGR